MSDPALPLREILDHPEEIRRRDVSDYLAILQRLPHQIEEALQLGKQTKVDREGPPIRNLLLCGMGGSAVGGDFLQTYLQSHLRVPFTVNRGYSLPGYVDQGTLVFVCSYSGNTEETLSGYRLARRAEARVICISSNGELQDLATAEGCPWVKIPAGHPPRTALGYLFISLLPILTSLKLAPDCSREVEQSLGWVQARSQLYGPDSPVAENAAKNLALQLHGRLPIVYGSEGRLVAVARRWSQQFCENSKQLAYYNALPELTHNEIVGWRHPPEITKRAVGIFLRDREDHERVQMRAEATRDLLAEQGDSTLEYWSDGDSWLQRLWTLVLLGDYASVYLALLNQEDPTPVEVIDYLKDRLKQAL